MPPAPPGSPGPTPPPRAAHGSPPPGGSSTDLVSHLLDRCEVTHFTELYDRWVDARKGAVPLSALQKFDPYFTATQVQQDIAKHPILLLAHPPRPADITVPGGDTWYVVDHRGLNQWIRRLFCLKGEDVQKQVGGGGFGQPGSPPDGVGLVVSLADIGAYIGVGGDQFEKLDLLLERVADVPGIFLRRTEGRDALSPPDAAPALLPSQVFYQQLSRFRVPVKRRQLYQLLAILLIFVISLTFLLSWLGAV